MSKYLRKFVWGLALVGILTSTAGISRAEVPVFDLGEIVVTATRWPRPIGEISSSVTVIGANEIAEREKITVLLLYWRCCAVFRDWMWFKAEGRGHLLRSS